MMKQRSLFLTLSWSTLLATCLVVGHRVFPAAQIEDYTDDDGRRIGFLRPKRSIFESDFRAQDSSILDQAIQRFLESLTHVPDFADEYAVNPGGLELFEIAKIQVEIRSSNTTLFQGVDESYSIDMRFSSNCGLIQAETIFGALHGLETLGQLLDFAWLEQGSPTYLIHGMPLRIEDEPAYAFRGLLIDTSRHYLPMNLILANLDAMAMNKMNVLHWHIVDDVSFPYRMESHPEIAEKGAYHPKMIYTTENIQRVIHEAYLRGIRVIPEVDMPGHTRAIGKSHPEYMSHCPQANSPLNPTNPEIFTFVTKVYSDLKNLFPDSMVHVGGDEVDLSCWEKSADISAWMKAHNMTDVVELYEYFETRLLRIVDTFDKVPIVWQEVFNLNLTITPETIVDVWKGFDLDTIEAAVAQNFTVVLSGCWYLDHLDKRWQDFYKCDPANFTGNPSLMLGGHASMWGEHVDASNFVSRVWPRASVVAERLWTGNVSLAETNLEERLHRFRCRMVQQGFAAGPVNPGVCPHEVPYLPEFPQSVDIARTSLSLF